METIAALKTLVRTDHNEKRHPAFQGFATPLIAGLTSYSLATLSAVVMTMVLFT